MAAPTTSPPKNTRSARKGSSTISLHHLFSRYRGIVFAVLIIGGLAAAIFRLNSIIILSDTATDYVPPTTSTTFDDETIEHLRELTPSNEAPKPLEIPSGRIDPFRQ